MIRRRLVITGRVQNVFYRASFVEEMRGLGIRGWVRNRADNSVEAVIEGPSEMVEAALAKARQGSPASRVDAVAVHDDAPPETFEGFEKRATH
ncbi:acylphosphatase [uncultured Sphingomonas sp.]|uniref:acylphosphatase n=1 Tax=unclassified Sphingomonas TaxID=196159 RepID=UPI0025ED3B88|nr:acylphosphatase [uncultured Sphingomonas sp.]